MVMIPKGREKGKRRMKERGAHEVKYHRGWAVQKP
jgi:hypothetical protein